MKRRHRRSSSSPSSSESESVSGGDGGDTFVWKAKIEKLKKQGIDPREYMKDRAPRAQEELQAELAKVRARRAQREAEREAWEVEKARMEREAGLVELGDWEAKEEEFHLQQAAKRAEIRVRDGRPTPADILYTTLHQLGGAAGTSLRDPPSVIAGIAGAPELAELRKDVAVFLELDAKVPEHREWWEALTVVIDDALVVAEGKADAMHPEIADDITGVF
jgi:hypothetical protein